LNEGFFPKRKRFYKNDKIQIKQEKKRNKLKKLIAEINPTKSIITLKKKIRENLKQDNNANK